MTVQNEHKQGRESSKQDVDEQIGVEKNLKERLNTANSELVQDVLEGEIALDNLTLANKQRNSCPELYQVQQLFSLDDNQLNKNCMERLMMLNTTMITSAIIETDSSLELMSSSSDEKTTSEINTNDTNVREKLNLIASKTASKKEQKNKKHYKQTDEQHIRKRRMVKAMSQVEPLSLIEKVREIRFAVQRSLDSAEATVSKSIGQIKQTASNKQKLRKKRKEQSISSIKSSSLPPSDHLSFYNHQEKNLPSLNDQIIHTTSLHTEIYPTSSPSSTTATTNIHQDKEAHHSPPKSIHQHLTKFNKSSNQSDYFETQETYANDQLDYNLNLKNFKFKDDENQPLSCFHSTSISPSSSSSSSPSTMLGTMGRPLTTKLSSRKARAKQIEEEEDFENDENVCSSAKKKRKSLTQRKQELAASTAVQHLDSNSKMTICNRHPFTIKRRSASLDQLQTNQLCTCTRQHLLYQQPTNRIQQSDLDNQDTSISTIYRGPFQPFGQLSNQPDYSNIHYMHPNRKGVRTPYMPTSITTHLITSDFDSSTDHNQQNSNKFQANRLDRLAQTNHPTMLTSNLTFSSSPSIKCDVVSYI